MTERQAMSEARLEIPLNRKKFLIRGCVFGLAALMGIWLFLSYAHQQNWMTPWVVQVMACILTFIFGILATNDLQKGLGNPVGLVITPEGFIDHAGNPGIGLIRWKEIKDIHINNTLSAHHILVEMRKPDSFKKKTVNPIQKNLMNTHIKLYGTPVVIQANQLAIDSSKLLEELRERL